MYIKIRVIAGSKIEKFEKLKDDEFRIWVKLLAENNAANNRVLEIVRGMYPNKSVRIISGHHSPSKIISIG
jgi:uncharacterized protein YggU (UPF0235/DUF167 family)